MATESNSDSNDMIARNTAGEWGILCGCKKARANWLLIQSPEECIIVINYNSLADINGIHSRSRWIYNTLDPLKRVRSRRQHGACHLRGLDSRTILSWRSWWSKWQVWRRAGRALSTQVGSWPYDATLYDVLSPMGSKRSYDHQLKNDWDLTRLIL
jgi:hypothetical protein